MTPSLFGRHFIRPGALGACILAAAGIARGSYDVPIAPELDANSTAENWVSFSVGAFGDQDGSPASYQRRSQHEDAGFGGIDSLRYRKSLPDDRTLKIDGKAMFGDNQFQLKIVLEDEANGWYVGAGYRESRIFYAGSGGYSPGALWHQPYDDQAWIDRGEVWAETGVKKDTWNLRIRGSHAWRKGTKDSTMWGESIYAGLGNTARKIVPTSIDLDETRTSIQIDFGYTGESLDAGGGLRFENIELENTTISLRNPGQANPNPNTGGGQRYQVTRQGSDADLFSGHGYVVSRIGEKFTLSGAASTTKVDTVLSGYRRFGAAADSPYIANFPRAGTAHGYEDFEGDTQWKQWVLVGNAQYRPASAWTITGGLRFENQTQDSVSHYLETAGPANNPLEEPFEQDGSREFDEVLLTLDAAFTGLADWVFTPFLEYATGEGSLVESQLEGHDAPLTVVVDRDTEYDRDLFKYGLNARWYPARWANFGAGAWRKERNNAYDTRADNTPPTGGNRYPAFITDQDFTTDDLYLRGTVRLNGSFSLTGRWDKVRTKIDSTEEMLAGVLSAEHDADIVSATLNWSPARVVNLQVGVNFVNDEMITGTVSANAAAAPSVGRFDNDYRTYSAIILWAIDENSDLQVDGYRFKADNYRGQHTLSLPYGLQADEDVLGVTYSRKLSANMKFSLRYVVRDYTEQSAGGNMDYDSQMLYGRMQMWF